MDDPKIKEAMAKTEEELNKREMGLMERHKDVLEHGKATLEMKQDLAKQQVKGKYYVMMTRKLTLLAHLQSADLEDFKKQYEEAKDNAAKLLAEKEAEYKAQMEEAQAKIKAAQVIFWLMTSLFPDFAYCPRLVNSLYFQNEVLYSVFRLDKILRFMTSPFFQEKVQADIAAKQAELLAGIEQMQAQQAAEEKQQL